MVKQEEFSSVDTHVGGAGTNDNDGAIAALLVPHSKESTVGVPIIEA